MKNKDTKNTKDTNVNRIIEYIRKEIMYSNFKPGEHLKEEKIAKHFNISRVPVRESLRILHSEGYVEMIPNRGSFVKKISHEYFVEMTNLYLFIAPELLKNAIPKYKESTFKKADSVINKIEKCKNFSKVGYLLWDFAKVIYSPSDFKFMYNIMNEIYKHNIRILNDLYEMRKHSQYDLTPHKKFLELCKKNKSGEAIAHWEDYLKKLSANLSDIKFKKK